MKQNLPKEQHLWPKEQQLQTNVAFISLKSHIIPPQNGVSANIEYNVLPNDLFLSNSHFVVISFLNSL